MTLHQHHFVPPLPLIVAEELGLLADAGVDIVTTRTRGSGEQLAHLLAEDVDVVITAIDNLFAWNAVGADVRVLAQIERTTSLALFARPPHVRIEDLDGGVLAVDATGNGFALVGRLLLSRAGVDMALVEAGGVQERLEVLVAGTADATLLGPPFDRLALDAGMRLLVTVEDALPDYPGQGLIARRDLINDRSEELRAYLAVLETARVRAEEMGAEEVTRMVTERGFPPAAAAAVWRGRPTTLEPSDRGLEAVVDVRRSLGALPSGFRGVDELRDLSILRSQ